MKLIRFVAIVAVFALSGAAITKCGTNAIGGNDKAEWTEAVRGLQCRLTIQKNEYALGEPIIVDFELRNLLKKTILVYQGYNTEVTTSFDIRDCNGNKVDYRGYFSGLGLRFPTVLPGTNDHRDRTGYYKCGKSFDLATEYSILKPGSYKVTATYSAGQRDPVNPRVEIKGIDVWSGELKSNTIEINVADSIK